MDIPLLLLIIGVIYLLLRPVSISGQRGRLWRTVRFCFLLYVLSNIYYLLFISINLILQYGLRPLM